MQGNLEEQQNFVLCVPLCRDEAARLYFEMPLRLSYSASCTRTRTIRTKNKYVKGGAILSAPRISTGFGRFALSILPLVGDIGVCDSASSAVVPKKTCVSASQKLFEIFVRTRRLVEVVSDFAILAIKRRLSPLAMLASRIAWGIETRSLTASRIGLHCVKYWRGFSVDFAPATTVLRRHYFAIGWRVRGRERSRMCRVRANSFDFKTTLHHPMKPGIVLPRTNLASGLRQACRSRSGRGNDTVCVVKFDATERFALRLFRASDVDTETHPEWAKSAYVRSVFACRVLALSSRHSPWFDDAFYRSRDLPNDASGLSLCSV